MAYRLKINASVFAMIPADGHVIVDCYADCITLLPFRSWMSAVIPLEVVTANSSTAIVARSMMHQV